MLNSYTFKVSETLYYTFSIGAKSEKEARQIAEQYSEFITPDPTTENEVEQEEFEYKYEVIELLHKEE
tara:strand:+ start:512 stop:715 length:204 start_codon:yes stop_codon:yes gene_type:complete